MGRETIREVGKRGTERGRERRGHDRTTIGDMKERENDSQGPHKQEHFQAKSKPPLCLCCQ